MRVLIVDDHPVFATTLARALTQEPDIEVVATATTAEDALEALGRGADVVLVDFRLSGETGAELTRRILERSPSSRVVMLTASADEAVLASALEAGCTGFVTKTETLEAVLATVRAAAAGEAMITPALLARLLPRLRSRRPGPNPDLTPRERDVLALIARGLSNQEIADALVLSRDTVRNHVASILAKLGVRSKLQAAVLAYQRGLVDPDPPSPR